MGASGLSSSARVDLSGGEHEAVGAQVKPADAKGYEKIPAQGDFGEPKWPDMSFEELARRAAYIGWAPTNGARVRGDQAIGECGAQYGVQQPVGV